jgi:hypothetical protein
MKGRNEHQVKNRLKLLLKARSEAESTEKETDLFTSSTTDNTPFSRDHEANKALIEEDDFTTYINRLKKEEQVDLALLPTV